MSIYENILFSTIKSLCVFNSKLFYFGHSWEELIEWLADNKFNYVNLYLRESSLSSINFIIDLKANDLTDHVNAVFLNEVCLEDANDFH